MSTILSKRGSGWLATCLVLAVLLIAGSRLIVLSMQHHATQARESAQAMAARSARAIESQLQALAAIAQRQAARAAGTVGRKDARPRPQAVATDRNTFWMAADGAVLRSKDSDPMTVEGIAKEWAVADSRQGTEGRLLGPVRLGSQWILAARAPVMLRSAYGTAVRAGWSVAFRDLDQLLLNAKIDGVARAGYDFELSQLESASGQPQIFTSSSTTPLAKPATSAIRLPAGFLPNPSAPVLMIAIRPRAGWYPATELTADVGLLAVVAWFAALGVLDVTRHLRLMGSALAVSKRRLQAVNQRLMREIEQREGLQQSIDHARYHDAFTGLPNRRYFMDQLDRALRDVRTRRDYHIAIILVDVDRFKLINDTLGHTAGDEVMMQAARRFEKAAATLECVLARWGGDQFALLLGDVHSADTAIAIGKLLQEALRAPFELRKHRVRVAANIGVSFVDSGLQRVEDALREADIALSVAKASGKIRVVAYNPAMRGNVLSLVSLEADLHVALERDELRLLFQPIVDLRHRRIVGAEALLRWLHPVEGLLTPDKFLALAEEAGLIVPITRWIILRVCKLAQEWRRRLPPGTDFYVSINLSAAALRDPGLSDYIASVLQQTQTSARSLKFELTEGGLINNVGAAREALDGLHQMGIELMLDDFGTGYSSLSHLQLFPFDYVKIDGPFDSRSGSARPGGGALVRAMVQMASSLGLKAIAEVVETQPDAQALQQMGCEFGQGHFFCEPVEAEEALQALSNPEFRTRLKPEEALAASALVAESPVTAAALASAAARTSPDIDSTIIEPVESAGGVPHDSVPTLVIPAESTATITEPVEADAASAQHDDASPLIEPPEPVAARVAHATAPAPVKPTRSTATPAESVEPDEAAESVEDTAGVPADNSSTLMIPGGSYTLSTPYDDAPTVSEDMEDSGAGGVRSDNSPTLMIPAGSYEPSAPYDDSQTVAEPMEEPDASSGLPDDAPTLPRSIPGAPFVDSPTVVLPDESDAANASYDDPDDPDSAREPLNASKERRTRHWWPRRMG